MSEERLLFFIPLPLNLLSTNKVDPFKYGEGIEISKFESHIQAFSHIYLFTCTHFFPITSQNNKKLFYNKNDNKELNIPNFGFDPVGFGMILESLEWPVVSVVEL